jgi:hypothetical protein
MLTKPPLVPSNDALRLLRQLAFASSALAAVGVVTLNYEVYRRIRLAEQCLETKRQIRALSNGKGKASLALLFDAAEKGQDCSHRAMRERQMEEKRLRRSISASCGDHGVRGQESRTSPIPPRAKEAHQSRQQTAQEIREATMTMVSTTPTHAYGRPRRYTKPTRHWPEVRSREQVAAATSAPSARKELHCGDEAAERIKRATMALTSEAPTHIFGRPQKSGRKARPNMHAAVATWLDTASDADTPTHIHSTGTIDGMDSKSSSVLSSQSIEAVRHGADEAVDHLAPKSTELKARSGMSTSPDKISVTPPNKGPENECGREADQTTAGSSASHAASNTPHRTTHVRPHSLDIPPFVAIEAPPVAFRNGLAQEADEVEKSSDKVTSMLGEVGTDDLGRQRPSSSLADHLLQDPKHGELPTMAKRGCSGQDSPSTPGNLGAGSPDRDDTARRHPDFINGSTCLDRTPSEATQWDEQAPPRQQYHNILLEQPPTSNETDSPNFMSWKYLKTLTESPSFGDEEDHPSDGDVTQELQQGSWKLVGEESDTFHVEQQQVSQEDADTKSEQSNSGQERSEKLWTPSLISSLAPENGDAECETVDREQQQVPPEPAAVGKKDTQSEQEVPKQWWTPYPRRELDRDLMPAQLDQPENLNNSENVVHAPKDSTMPKSVVPDREMAALARQIHNAFSLDHAAGKNAWREAADDSLRRNDFATLDFLYAEFVETGVIGISPRYYVVRALIQWHYEVSKYSERAAEILFPDQAPGQITSAAADSGRSRQHLSLEEKDKVDTLFATRFLQGLWEFNANTSWVLLNFRRVLAAAKFRGVKLVEDLFAVVIRLLASSGDMASAHALYDEMAFYHQIEPTFFTRTLIIRGYARICNWQRVEREVESLHHSGISRTRPHGYALMFNAVLKEYAARASIEQFQNFLVTGISFWGLIPTSNISITTVQAYLARQRYDLVREWMETLQVLFPQIETETRLFQWLLGNSWQRTGATCQQIEETIKAVAYRNPYTKMKSVSLPTIHEALSRDLAAKIEAAQANMQRSEPESATLGNEGNDLVCTKTIDDYLSTAYSLAASALSPNQQPTPEIIELHRQASAVQRVTTFLNGSPSSEVVDNFIFPEPTTDTSNTHVDMNMGPVAGTFNLSHLQDTIPTILTAEFLPETETITRAILEFYRTRFLHNLPTDHTLLMWVCEKLVDASRSFDAVFVLEKVCSNSLVCRLAGVCEEDQQGPSVVHRPAHVAVAFGIHFYEFWMYVACVTKSYVQWNRVVNEVLRLSRPSRMALIGRGDGSERTFTGVRVTSSFLFLTQTLAMRGLRGWGWRWNLDYSRRSIQNINWSIRQLEKRLELQSGRLPLKPWAELRQAGATGWRKKRPSDFRR